MERTVPSDTGLCFDAIITFLNVWFEIIIMVASLFASSSKEAVELEKHGKIKKNWRGKWIIISLMSLLKLQKS
jgi:phosphatidylglycerophosphate synthase